MYSVIQNVQNVPISFSLYLLGKSTCFRSKWDLFSIGSKIYLRLQLVVLIVWRSIYSTFCADTNCKSNIQRYLVHIIFRWHLGMCKWECTPTYRGFDTFYGYYNGQEDYYNYTVRKYRHWWRFIGFTPTELLSTTPGAR